MKLIAILFLCSRLLPSFTQEPDYQEIDCNHKDVFQAVDAALKKFNSNNQSSNQFVLVRITEVNQTINSDAFYSVKYEVKEGDCPVQSDKTWQDCDYKDAEEAATGECTAIVGKRRNDRFAVAAQTCHIIPAGGPEVTTEYACLGCVHPISTKSPELESILTHGIQHFNNNTKHAYLFTLGEVRRAERQVVRGWNYEVAYSIIQTNCSKEKFLLLSSECKFLPDGDTGECVDNVYVDHKGRIDSFSQNCEVYQGVDFVAPSSKLCAGCPRPIPVDNLELQEALTHSIRKLNAENNETFYFKVDTVKSATVQVVAGKKFAIEFIASETTCSKESNQELTESCETKKPGQRLTCNADVFVIPWENKIYPTVNCQTVGKMTLMKRPPGFSPFRTVQIQRTEETTDSDLIEAVMPTMPPAPSENDDDWIPDILIEPDSLSFKLIPDLPETTSPKCPGRPWKPVDRKNPIIGN
ncbi:kininogen-1 isoform X3 [Heterocephalus glaber]|uniref:Kininogen-1 isoform X3 n=1 Tax=Heterocephalus glaber TaxID=10181 RepID=A0AAX6SQV3_HETGA|nr:kininogen-1 isoform X3 [Heterocephalus glaber]